jgi:hypothetical protein
MAVAMVVDVVDAGVMAVAVVGIIVADAGMVAVDGVVVVMAMGGTVLPGVGD